MAVVCIQLKRGMSSSWADQNPVLAVGEPGFEKDTGRLKIGNGFSPWLELDYVGEDAAAYAAIEALELLVGDTAVATQITNAIAAENLAQYAKVSDIDALVDEKIAEINTACVIVEF